MTNNTGKILADRLTRKWIVAALLCAAPVFFLFAYCGEPGRGRAAAAVAAIMVISVRGCWDLKKRLQFWLTVAIVVACQVPLVLLVPWTNRSYPGYTLLPIGMLDFVFVYGTIRLFNRSFETKAP